MLAEKWLTDLFKHMKWADAVVWQSVLALPEAENDARLRYLLHHIHLTQHAFLRIWLEQSMKFREVADFGSVSEISDWGKEYHERLAAYVEKNEELALEQTVVLPWSQQLSSRLGRPPGPTSLGETMLQVTAHSTYHRGQVNARLRELGAEPPLVDFIAWIWYGRPPASWPISGR